MCEDDYSRDKTRRRRTFSARTVDVVEISSDSRNWLLDVLTQRLLPEKELHEHA